MTNKENFINIRQILVDKNILYRMQCKERFQILEVGVIKEKQPTFKKWCFSIGDRILKCV